MLEKAEISNVEHQIKDMISTVRHTHHQWFVQQTYNGFYGEEYKGWTEHWMKERLKDLYYLITFYLEGKGLSLYLQEFKDEYRALIDDDKEILNSKLVHPEGEEELVLLEGFNRFLYPFKSFSHTQENINELNRLTSILQNTGFILKNSKAQIKNESQIYNQVKWVLELFYPTVKRKRKASFIQQFKTYEPDILIPELKVAIEYKYIAKETDNVDDYLDQLKIDATNYVADHNYETFFAVIYIENIGIATPEGIELAWLSKHFPSNWKKVIAGYTIKSSSLPV